jgi:hypothetical protein
LHRKSTSCTPTYVTKVLFYFRPVHARSIDTPIVQHYSFYRGFARSGFIALTFGRHSCSFQSCGCFKSGDRVAIHAHCLRWVTPFELDSNRRGDPRTSPITAPGPHTHPLTAKKAAAVDFRPKAPSARFLAAGRHPGAAA